MMNTRNTSNTRNTRNTRNTMTIGLLFIGTVRIVMMMMRMIGWLDRRKQRRSLVGVEFEVDVEGGRRRRRCNTGVNTRGSTAIDIHIADDAALTNAFRIGFMNTN